MKLMVIGGLLRRSVFAIQIRSLLVVMHVLIYYY